MTNIEFKDDDFVFDDPKSYFKIIDDFVVGQDDLKKTLSLCCFRHNLLKEKYKYNPNHMLIAGPSGTGKTFSISTLLENIDLSYIIFDSSTVTVTGYVGTTFESAISVLYHSTGNNIYKTENGVIVFDEIDKLFTTSNSIKEDVTRFGAQNELLRLLEGNTIQIQSNFNEDPIFINTSKILFIFLGSFNNFKSILYDEGMNLYESTKEKQSRTKINNFDFPEKLLRCGFSTELVGRISYFSQTFSLTKKEIKDAINSKNSSLVSSYKDFFKLFSLDLKLEDSFIDYVIEKAELEKFGMRRISHLLNDYLFNLMYEINDLKEKVSNNKNINISYSKQKGVHFTLNKK